eukprot:8925579-Ditylum_brightwellii.AAC.1
MFSQLTGFVELLRSEPMIVAIAWANLLSLDYCLAREVYLEGQELGIPTRHSLARASARPCFRGMPEAPPGWEPLGWAERSASSDVGYRHG